MGKLSGKVAIVTGSGRGIGNAIAEAYLKEDARVTVTAAQQRDEIEPWLRRTVQRGCSHFSQTLPYQGTVNG